ncbi:MAG: caspase family protein [Cyanobacteria bacterium SZAS-4]|nr:caspase family protein [Cyanobacteria bacterium SZAS-4]
MSSSRIKFFNTRALTSVIAGGFVILANSFPIAARSADQPASATSAASEAGKASGGNYAFLVAIDEYISPDINTLNGCNKDIRDIQEVLVKNGFPKDAEHIKVLSNKAATKQAIVDGFRSQLVENAKKHPDAFFYFQYSGHGSRMKDPTGGDEDGYDETIVPADSRTPDHYDLLDKEIAPLIAELTQYTKNAILTFDSCHSGNINRDSDIKIKGRRAVKDDSRAMPASLSAKKRALDAGAGFAPRRDSYICMSACLPTQTAQETEDASDSDKNGLMTRNLIAALRKAKPDTTYRQLLAMIRANMPQEQIPQFDGDLDRVVFGSAAQRSDASLRVSKLDKANKVLTIDGGSNLGITEGSVIAFYKSNTLKLVGEKDLLGKGLVTKVMPLSCEVTIPENVKDDEVSSAKAVVACTKLKAEPQRVIVQVPSDSKLNTDAAKEILETFEEAVKSDPVIKITGKESNPFKARAAACDVVLASNTFDKFDTGMKLKDAPPGDTPVYFITNTAGTPLFNFFVSQNDQSASKKIVNAIRKKSQQAFIRSLSNQLSPLNDKLKLSIIRVKGYENNAAKTPIEAPPLKEDQLGAPNFRVGDKFKLAVQNTSDVPLYINVLTIGTSGAIATMYTDPSKSLAPGDTVKTDVMNVGYPLGTETLKVIATTKPADFSVLEQASALRDPTPAPKGNAALQDVVSHSLSRLRDLTKDQAPEAAQLNLDDWTAANLDYVIKDRAAVATNK